MYPTVVTAPLPIFSMQGGKDLSEPELARALAHESREAAAVSWAGWLVGCSATAAMLC